MNPNQSWGKLGPNRINQILVKSLVETCKKYETQNEKLIKENRQLRLELKNLIRCVR